MKAYRFGEVLAHTHATRSQLIHWADIGLITPSINDTAGTGHQRVFSFRNLIEVRVAVILAAHGLRKVELTYVLRTLRQHLDGLSKRAALDAVWWISGFRRVDAIWHGSIQEFTAELHQRFGINARVGFVLQMGAIVKDLEQDTADRL